MDKDVPYYIYQIKNKVTSTVYIGVTKDVNKRFREHRVNSSNKYLRKAIELFGITNFEFTILEVTTLEFVSDKEIKYIKNARSCGKTYNISAGGLIGNGAPAEEHWNHDITENDVINIRELYSTDKITQKALAELFNLSKQHVSKILRGERWASVRGARTLYSSKNKVANRRKLTDKDVLDIRTEAFEEYTLMGRLDISEAAKIIGVSRQSLRRLLLGISYPHIPGPILRKDYYEGFGKNGI